VVDSEPVLLPQNAAGSMAAITCHRPHLGAPS